MGETKNTVRVGCGSAYSRDPADLAVKMAEDGGIEYLCCDRLAERTLAKATADKKDGTAEGYNPLLEDWFSAVLPICYEKAITILGNFGAASPEAAGEKISEIAKDLDCRDLTIATITGDDVLDKLDDYELTNLDTGEPLTPENLPGEVVSANAYIGVEPMLDALDSGADIIIGGRIADMSPYLAVMMHEFGWGEDELQKKARGTSLAHLLECGTYSTGGNFGYPGYVRVPEPDNLGLPLVEVGEDGVGIISKPDGTGGVVSELSMTSQLVYEVHDPANYKTPDVTVDMQDVKIEQIGEDKVKVTGAKGKPRPEEYKVLVGVDEGYKAEIESGWGGRDALAKADMTIEEAIKPTLEKLDEKLREVQINRVGVDAIHGAAAPEPSCDPNEVRMRIAFKTDDAKTAEEVLDTLEPLTFFTAIGGGGLKRSVTSTVGTYPTLLPRDAVTLEVNYINLAAEEAKA